MVIALFIAARLVGYGSATMSDRPTSVQGEGEATWPNSQRS